MFPAKTRRTVCFEGARALLAFLSGAIAINGELRNDGDGLSEEFFLINGWVLSREDVRRGKVEVVDAIRF